MPLRFHRNDEGVERNFNRKLNCAVWRERNGGLKIKLLSSKIDIKLHLPFRLRHGRKAAQSHDNNGWNGFEPRIKARFPLKCMKSFNLFSFNLSLHVVSRKFSIFSHLVWSEMGTSKKIEILCMMECLSKRIFTRLLLLSGREDFSIYFYKRNNFLQISRIWSIEWISTSHRRKTINTTISLPTVSTYGQSLGSAFRLVLQQHSLNECNIFYYFMCTENLLMQDLWQNVPRPGLNVDLVCSGNLFSSTRNWI